MDLCDYSKEDIKMDSFTKLRDDERVKEAMQYMQEHYDENISLEDIARATMISRSELCKSFRRAVDTSPKEFLIQYRIRQSMLLLEKPELRIADISEMTGFSSPSHFGSSFRSYVGCTPLQYRKNM
ncbi:MAG: AraC family transcriptional regulator [Eubacteriales bacterium]|nr:AraC family transcriptional regulator [Eubacteriales bacterium]